jgi:hypothetical protein
MSLMRKLYIPYLYEFPLEPHPFGIMGQMYPGILHIGGVRLTRNYGKYLQLLANGTL